MDAIKKLARGLNTPFGIAAIAAIITFVLMSLFGADLMNKFIVTAILAVIAAVLHSVWMRYDMTAGKQNRIKNVENAIEEALQSVEAKQASYQQAVVANSAMQAAKTAADTALTGDPANMLLQSDARIKAAAATKSANAEKEAKEALEQALKAYEELSEILPLVKAGISRNNVNDLQHLIDEASQAAQALEASYQQAVVANSAMQAAKTAADTALTGDPANMLLQSDARIKAAAATKSANAEKEAKEAAEAAQKVADELVGQLNNLKAGKPAAMAPADQKTRSQRFQKFWKQIGCWGQGLIALLVVVIVMVLLTLANWNIQTTRNLAATDAWEVKVENYNLSQTPAARVYAQGTNSAGTQTATNFVSPTATPSPTETPTATATPENAATQAAFDRQATYAAQEVANETCDRLKGAPWDQDHFTWYEEDGEQKDGVVQVLECKDTWQVNSWVDGTATAIVRDFTATPYPSNTPTPTNTPTNTPTFTATYTPSPTQTATLTPWG